MIESFISLAGDDIPTVISEKAGNALEALGLGGSVTLLGVAIVFLALVSLILITWLYPKIAKFLINKVAGIKANGAKKKTEKSAKKTASDLAVKQDKTIIEANSEEIDDSALIAVITAAIAASLGTSSNGIVIKSLRRSGASIPSWGLEGRNEQVYNRF